MVRGPLRNAGSGTEPSRPNSRYPGWGCLVLPDHSFKPVKTYREALGLAKKHIYRNGVPNSVPGWENWLDITCSLFYLKDAAAEPRIYLRNRHVMSYADFYDKNGGNDLRKAWRSEDEDEDDDAEEVEPVSDMASSPPPSSSANWELVRETTRKQAPPGANISEEEERKQGFRLRRVIVPSLGQTLALDGMMKSFIDFAHNSMARSIQIQPLHFLKAELGRYGYHRHHESAWKRWRPPTILRTTATDVELQPLDLSPRRAAGIVCKDVLVWHKPSRRGQAFTPYDMQPSYSERVHLLCHVAELNLVVVGSLTGRAALLTLTRTRKRCDGVALRQGFRVDWILPRRQEEAAGLRPWATLHGIAVSPVPGPAAEGVALHARDSVVRREMPPKYRLIMHYADHTILRYEIARQADEESDLLIF